MVEWSRYLVRAYLQNTITLDVEFEHCKQLAISVQIENHTTVWPDCSFGLLLSFRMGVSKIQKPLETWEKDSRRIAFGHRNFDA